MGTDHGSQRRHRLLYVGVGVMLLASVAIAVGLSHRVAVHAPSTAAEREDTFDASALVDRLDAIERRLAVLETFGPQPLAYSSSNPTIEDDTGEREPSTRGTDEILERVARLEQIERDRQEAQRRRAAQRRAVEEARRVEQMQRAVTAMSVLTDPVVPDEAKARAWGSIRMNAADTWTDQIVAEAVRIGTTSPNAQIRADIWRQAHANRTHPMLLQPLLQALISDADRAVREEAAETLDLYLDEPGVREALQLAAESDADPGVRRQATVSLAGPRGGF